MLFSYFFIYGQIIVIYILGVSVCSSLHLQFQQLCLIKYILLINNYHQFQSAYSSNLKVESIKYETNSLCTNKNVKYSRYDSNSEFAYYLFNKWCKF